MPDLVHAALDLLVDDARGTWHLTNQGTVSWHAFAERVAQEARLPWRTKPRVVRDGRNTSLSSERTSVMPSLESSISRYLADCEVDWKSPRFLDAAE